MADYPVTATQLGPEVCRKLTVGSSLQVQGPEPGKSHRRQLATGLPVQGAASGSAALLRGAGAQVLDPP